MFFLENVTDKSLQNLKNKSANFMRFLCYDFYRIGTGKTGKLA